MVIVTNHVPKMMAILQNRQKEVNADGETQRFFFLKVSDPLFGIRALQRLVVSDKVEIKPLGSGDVVARLKEE